MLCLSLRKHNQQLVHVFLAPTAPTDPHLPVEYIKQGYERSDELLVTIVLYSVNRLLASWLVAASWRTIVCIYINDIQMVFMNRYGQYSQNCTCML